MPYFDKFILVYVCNLSVGMFLSARARKRTCFLHDFSGIYVLSRSGTCKIVVFFEL